VRPVKKGLVDLGAAMVFAALGVFLMVGAARLPGFGETHQSPGITPFAVGAFITACSLALGFGAAGRLRRRVADNEAQKLAGSAIRAVGMLVLMGAYLATMAFTAIPFLYATFAFLMASMMYLGAGAGYRTLIIAASTALAMWFVFGYVFRVPLP